MQKLGLDVSHHAYDVVGLPIGWSEVRRQGYELICLKASDGLNIWHNKRNYGKIDPFFLDNWKAIAEVGFPLRCAYPFFENEVPWTDQLSFFLAAFPEGAPRPTAAHWLDAENKVYVRGLKLWDALQGFLDGIEGKFQMRPDFYTSRGWLAWADLNYGKRPDWLKNYRLVLADYNPKPIIPPPWTEMHILQSNRNWKVPGIPGGVSLDFVYD